MVYLMNKKELIYQKKLFNRRNVKCPCCNGNKEFINKRNRIKTNVLLKKENYDE